MTTAETTAATRRGPRLRAVAIGVVGLALVTSLGVLLYAYGPRSMLQGYISGLAITWVAFGIAGWRVAKRPGRTTTAERALLGAGDERDSSALTDAFATLGALAVPATAIAAVALAIGAPVAPVMAVLIWGQLIIGVVAFTVMNRRR